MRYQRLFAVDPSLTCSGWALFHIGSEKLRGVGKIRSKPPKIPLAVRLEDLQEQITNLFQEIELSANDVLICEAQTTMRDPRAAFKVEQVRGIFETLARERGICAPGRLNPRSVQSELMGLRGKQVGREEVKAAAVALAGQLYAEPLRDLGFAVEEGELKRHQDIVDALLVGALALSRIAEAVRGDLSLEEVFDERQSKYHSRVSTRW